MQQLHFVYYSKEKRAPNKQDDIAGEPRVLEVDV